MDARSLLTHCTMTLPVIFGWIEQKYGYDPALLKVKENFSSVSSTLDLKTPSVLTTVCGMSSRLVHVTVVPTGIVSVSGPKLKLSIFTSVVSGFCCALASKLFWPMVIVPMPITSVTVKTAIDTLLLMFFFLSIYFICRSDWFLKLADSRSRERRIDHGQRLLPLDVVHIGDSKDALQLLRRHFHRPRRRRLAWLWLRKCG